MPGWAGEVVPGWAGQVGAWLGWAGGCLARLGRWHPHDTLLCPPACIPCLNVPAACLLTALLPACLGCLP